MTRDEWYKSIRLMSEGVGTYRKEFESVMWTLADILEQRDRAYQDFIDAGAEVVITKISDRGAENIGKNPRLQTWSDLNTQALSFWRDLGLTPAGLKKLNEAAMKTEQKESALEKALKSLGSQKLGDGKKIRNGDPGRKENRVHRNKTGG